MSWPTGCVLCSAGRLSATSLPNADYSGSGNQFWPVLSRVGLTPRLLRPDEFRDLLGFGIGLTDIVKKVHGADKVLVTNQFDVAGLRSKMRKFAPHVLAFNGKKAAEAFFGRRRIAYGWAGVLDETRLFVLPSTSGAARGYWDEQHWRELADYVRLLEELSGP